MPGVYSTAAGHAGGSTENPTYEEVCSGLTGHAEVVLAVFDPAQIGYETLLELFWEGHNPTQGMRQGNDRGTHSDALKASRFGEITTEIAPLTQFYYAEDYHQQYLAKVPDGYGGIGGTGVERPCADAGRSPAGPELHNLML